LLDRQMPGLIERLKILHGEIVGISEPKFLRYPPTSVPVTWSLQVLPLDLKRSPDAIRHK
jgi:hypothetical protein